MSVINKMLRDLDSRQATRSPTLALDEPADSANTLAAALSAGTLPVGARRTATGKVLRHSGTRWRVGFAVVAPALVIGAIVFWWSMQRPTVSEATTQSPPLMIIARAPDLLPAPVVASPVSSPVTLPTVPSVPPKTALALAPTSSRLKVAGSLFPPTAEKATTAEPETLALKAQSELLRVPTMRAPTAAAVAVKPQRRADSEVVAQAQALWSEGARTAAIDLLQSAINRLELISASDTTSPLALATLAQEYARMTLEQGQPGEGLATLSRLESRLAGVADVWALRGNLAQRLGRHQEAVQAYERALALRPDEPRWMLGAAVSLAAAGQTVPAAVLAEKARSVGALRPDVANYLRRLGVVIRSD